MKLFTVTIAHTGDQLEILAESWREALELAGHDDACIVKAAGPGAFDATFLLDNTPRTLTTRARSGTDAEALRWTLDCALHVMERQAAGAGGGA